MIEQFEAHGLYVAFIAGVLLLVVVMAIDAIAQARRDRIRNGHLAAISTTTANIERGLIAKSNTEARWLG